MGEVSCDGVRQAGEEVSRCEKLWGVVQSWVGADDYFHREVTCHDEQDLRNTSRRVGYGKRVRGVRGAHARTA